MTQAPQQPQQPQQPNSWFSRFLNFLNFQNRVPVQNLVPFTLLLASSFYLLDKFNNLYQLGEYSCRIESSLWWCPSEPPEWIGTKIEDVYNKNISQYTPETTLVVTDKSEKTLENEDVSILRNVDQDMSRINLGKKRNSGQYEAFLRKAKNEKKPVCLQTYGKRNFEKSEFKNIIDYNEFPFDLVFKNLTSKQRDRVFKNLTPQQQEQLYKGLTLPQREQLYKSLTPQQRNEACKEFSSSPRWQTSIKRFF
jgi:hypothetical protein